MSAGELQLIRWLEDRLGASAQVPPGTPWQSALSRIGDDMASLEIAGGGSVLLGTDMLCEGCHFDRAAQTLEVIGRKALCCCLSDCAAMAAKPLAALVSLALPCGEVLDAGQRVMSGIIDAADCHDCRVIGGDITSWQGGLVIDVLTAAEPWPDREPVTRRGARPADLLAVTGVLGGSRMGKHLNFQPRVDEARQCLEAFGSDLHAMIDISDGLSLDLQRLCSASSCGAILEEDALRQVISDDAARLAQRDGRSPLEHALSDGEDYELLMAVAPHARAQLNCFQFPLHRIGTIGPAGLQLQAADGQLTDLQPRGYQH